MNAIYRFVVRALRFATKMILRVASWVVRRLTNKVDYHSFHIGEACHLMDPRGKRVLVVGCQWGIECGMFARLGAREVHGVDVEDDIGREFKAPNVRYIKTSAEALELPSSSYDLVYCVATMEHVHRIDKAFPELVRVAAPGGLIYCVAAPLWNSGGGHHKDNFFRAYPWIHLLYSEVEIIEICHRDGIVAHDTPIENHVRYMLNPRFFNKVYARDYVAVCQTLTDVTVHKNVLYEDRQYTLTPELWERLSAKGYTREELLSVIHVFIATKNSYR